MPHLEVGSPKESFQNTPWELLIIIIVVNLRGIDRMESIILIHFGAFDLDDWRCDVGWGGYSDSDIGTIRAVHSDTGSTKDSDGDKKLSTLHKLVLARAAENE